MTVAQFPSEVGQRLLDLLNDNGEILFGGQAGVDFQTFYGDQNRIGVTPTVCVESGETTRALAGVPSRTENQLVAYIIIYWAKVDSNQVTKLEAEQCAETVTRFLDKNLTLDRNADGGIVIHGFVTSINPGYTYRNQGQTLYQTVRLTWVGKSKTMLGA